jgi:AmiR/NasT family two-component response regulator
MGGTLRVERLVAAGARAYLTKPLDVRHLLQVIDDLTVVEGKDLQA